MKSSEHRSRHRRIAKFQVIRKSHGDDSVVEVTVGDIDTAREAGMTDDQSRTKICASSPPGG